MVVEPIFGGQEVQKAQNVKNRDVEKRSEAAPSGQLCGDGTILRVATGVKMSRVRC